MKTIKRELARVGQFGSDGTVVTEKDLKECADTFDGKCPIALGHKLADWMPKFGNAKTVSLADNGKTLVGELEIHDLLADAVEEKFYSDISAGIATRKVDGKRYLHHIAYLGAVPPKIRDLKVFSDLGVMYFGDNELDGVFEVSGEIKLKPKETDPAKKEDQKKDTSQEDSELALKEENDVLKKQLADINAKTLVTAKEGLKNAMAGRIPKVKHGLVLQLADQLGTDTTIELADAEGQKENLSGIDVLTRVIESIPKQVSEGKTDLGDDPKESTIDVSKLMSKI